MFIVFPVNVADVILAKQTRPLEVCINEQKYNLRQDMLEKSNLAQHAYEEGTPNIVESYQLNLLSYTAHTRNQLMSLLSTQLVNPVWICLHFCLCSISFIGLNLIYSVLSIIPVQVIWFVDYPCMILSLSYRVFDS